MTIGVLSHAPGGLGVFEEVMLLALPQLEPGALFGSLLVYRVLYYLFPFAVAACLLGRHERFWGSIVLTPSIQILQRVGGAMATMVMGGLFLQAGAFFCSRQPLRLWKAGSIHYGIISFCHSIEASHLLSSVVGFWLLILARGLSAEWNLHFI